MLWKIALTIVALWFLTWCDLQIIQNASKTFYRPLRFQRRSADLLFMVGIVIAVILILHLKMHGGQTPN